MDDLDPHEDPYNVTQASRIYFLPNAMTAGNLFCGFTAIINCIQARLAETSLDGIYNNATPAEHYRYAVGLIFGAAAFDMLDGRLARMGGRESLFGAEFDSLADVVSFGLAPALMMFFFILSPTQAQGYNWFRNIGWLVGFIYLLCAAMRLALFNVITNPLLHRDKKGFCNQREVEVDTSSFGAALRAALRQDPDVILVGEMRDYETIETAMTAAETGHLVMSTLHTMDAAETINRIIGVFPPYHQRQVRIQLSSIIKGVISQRLVKRAGGSKRGRKQERWCW